MVNCCNSSVKSWLGFIAIAVILSGSIVLFSGCNFGGGVSTSNTGNTSDPQVNATANSGAAAANADAKAGSTAASSPCSLGYYPVTDGVLRKYSVTGAGAENFSMSHSSVTDTGFVETRTFSSGLEIKNNWACEPDGIRNVEFSNTGIMKDANFTVETLKSSGVTLPRELAVGKEFESSYDIRANVNVKGLKADATGKVNAKSKVAALEDDVIVGNKLYRAIRIDSVISINLTVNGRGYEAANLKTSNWYADGVGLVKQDTKSTLGSQVVTLGN